MYTLQLTVASLVAALAAGSPRAARSQGTPEKRPNVVLICMDTVRADHLGSYGYRRNPTTPALDALTGEALLFRDTSATAGWTKPSIPSIFTGTYPLQHGVYEGSARGLAGRTSDVLGDEALTLAEVFHGAGYRTAAFVRNAQLRAGMGFEQGFETYAEGSGDAREIRWSGVDWIDAGGDDRPFFLYLHFLDAHWPYPVPPEYANLFTDFDVELFRGKGHSALRDAINDGERTLSPEEAQALRDLYDGSIRYIDDQLARLFAALRLRGQWEETIVCVVSDHGEEFGEHGKIGHGHGLYENLLQVPWILRIPGLGADVIETPVSLVDVFPTLLAAAGVQGAMAGEGVDRLAQPSARRPIFAEHKEPKAYQQSLRDGNVKVVRRFSASGERTVRLGPTAAVSMAPRWEVELEVLKSGVLYAVELEPQEDADGDPIEAKGVIDEVRENGLALLGQRFPWSGDVELYGDVPKGADPAAVLREGTAVKLVLDAADGHLSRVKVYEGDADFEVRGPVVRHDPSGAQGRLSIGPFRIVYDGDSEWELDTLEKALERWTKDDVFALLEPAGARAARAACRQEVFAVDLSAGAPIEARSPAADSPLLGALDSLGSQLFTRRVDAGEAFELDGDALDALRELGYIDE